MPFRLSLPESYKVCKSAISQAVSEDNWQDLGSFSDAPKESKNKPAHYQCYDTSIPLYDRSYRALVVHSDAHDRRKTKVLAKLLESDKEALTKIRRELERIEFACLPDAQAAADRIPKGRFHELVISVESLEKYAKGRPKADGPRVCKGMIFKLNARIEPNTEAIAKAERETGCFVLISNTPAEGDRSIPSKELLKIYKDQHHIERNFGFLKDPAIVNSLFLKTPARIEALGLVIVLALLTWRLMERTMRIAIESEGSKITGWNKRPTDRPTSFMMSTFFEHVLVIRMGEQRIVVHKFTDSQLGYLRLLGLSPKIFIAASSP
jgi:transposase